MQVIEGCKVIICGVDIWLDDMIFMEKNISFGHLGVLLDLSTHVEDNGAIPVL
jgi:hypothetical protein